MALPLRLEPVQVWLRVAAGAPGPEWEAALRDVAARGARAGLQIVGIPSPDDPLLAAAATSILFDVRELADAPAAALDDVVFRLKRAVALARGRGLEVEILAAPPLAAALEGRGLAGFGVTVHAVEQVPIARSLRDLLLDRTHDLWELPRDAVAAHALVADLMRLWPWLPPLVPYGSMTCGTIRIPAYADFAATQIVGVSDACPRGARVVPEQPGASVERLDVDDVSLFRVSLTSQDRFAETVGVSGAASLTADEIVARHQSQAARQAAEISTIISSGSLTLTFEAPGFVAPLTITSRTIIYAGNGRTDLQQQAIRVNGAAFEAGGGVPRLPIIEPERAAAPPLAITLNELYRYRLQGRDTIDGRPCYVIAFEPRDRRAPLYAGRAWIAADAFAMVRVSAVQTGLRGPITASEQTDEFRDDGHGRWLLARSDVRQTYEGASVRTPIHRLLILDGHDVNAPDFETRRAAAYASNDVMLRDTPDGFRYLTKEGRGKAEAERETPAAGSAADGPRAVAGRATRVRTLAFGVIVDPNISRPLPFAGLSYVDFDLLGTGTQFNGFFGGAFGQLAFSVPSIAGSRWQLAGRAFGIAASYNDRAFDQGREQYAQNILQRPAQAAVWALRPLTPRVSLRLEYDWDYTRFGRSESTDALFVVPANQLAHGARVGVDMQRGGWQVSLWGSAAHRVGWRRWGYASPRLVSAPAVETRSFASFQRYGASALRSLAINPRLVTRIEMAWMAGRDLDRFSRYSFGSFDNRLHGYPSALIRYDRGAVLRSALAWSAAKAVRLDAFADTAQVRDPGFGRRFHNFTGLGAALEVPAPFGTLLSAEWGFGLQGLDPDGHRGTHVFRIAGYKVF